MIYISLTHPSVTIFMNLYLLEEPNCLILTSNMFQSRNIAPILENNNLSYTSQNHSSVTILEHFVYRWQMNITAESIA